MQKLTFKKMWKHFRTIQKHRHWVKYYCCNAGLVWRGLTHDLSKYSPVEFFESARYWTGTSSPIKAIKADLGYSKAWLHHKGHNSHHWAYWTDSYSEGTVTHMMPKNDFVEMVCDFLGACRAYTKGEFSYKKEYEWWKSDRNAGNKAMHPRNKRMMDIILHDLAFAEEHYDKYDIKGIDAPIALIRQGYIQQVYEANCNDTHIH